MRKHQRRNARISILTGAALVLMGLTSVGSIGSAATVLAAGLPAEVASLNRDGGFVFSQINEGKNTITGMFTATNDPNYPEYIVEKYHFFWGEVSDEKMPEMVESTEGVTTIAKGSDGEEKFMRSWYQVEFPAATGVSLADNPTKIVSYAIQIKALAPGYSDKILAGRFDYSRCVNSEGYKLDGSVFCARDEWASGESFYDAYNQDWRKLKPLPEVKYVEKEASLGGVAEVSVSVAEAAGGVGGVGGVGGSVGVGSAGGSARANGAGGAGISGFGAVVAGTEEASVGDSATGETNIGEAEIADAGDEAVEVPELGGKNGDKSYLMWWLGFVALLSIGALGAFSWFFWPILPFHKKGNKKRK